MNEKGTPENLIPAHPKNTNAVRYGIHSPRLIQARAAEIEAGLLESCDLSPVLQLPLREGSRLMAMAEAIDRDLDERGFEDRNGKTRYLLEMRVRISRQLERWWALVWKEVERQAGAEDPIILQKTDYIRALGRIGVGKDPSATARDRVAALTASIARADSR